MFSTQFNLTWRSLDCYELVTHAVVTVLAALEDYQFLHGRHVFSFGLQAVGPDSSDANIVHRMSAGDRYGAEINGAYWRRTR
jgi:hypothetical protein